jgi:bis(5'-nucleosyl)-tetraphosphatase (symmetrical)
VTKEGLGDKTVAIIGDVHGCFDELQDLLALCKADELIFVGDMINKGPKSIETLALIRALPNAAFIRGNHENAVLEAFHRRKADKEFKPHLEWVDKLTEEDVCWLSALPFTMTLPEHKVLVVHAGVVPGRPLHEQLTVDMVTLRNCVPLPDGSGYTGTSNQPEGSVPWVSTWQGPEHLVFGHDAKRRLQQTPHATGLDTGCVYGGALSALMLPSRTIVSVPAKAVHCPPVDRE